MRYSLTPGAKQTACELVDSWEKEKLQQSFSIAYHSAIVGWTFVKGYDHSYSWPDTARVEHLQELANQNLIQFDDGKVILLQELKDAIKSRFGAPFTEEIMETARLLVALRREGKIEDDFYLVDASGGSGARGRQFLWGLGANVGNDVPTPPIAHLKEMEEHKLLRVEDAGKIHVTLYSRLETAVDTDFATIPDEDASGLVQIENYIAGNQHNLFVYGDIHLTGAEIADKLTNHLGDLVEVNQELKNALDQLRTATGKEPNELGNVVLELGRILDLLEKIPGLAGALKIIGEVIKNL